MTKISAQQAFEIAVTGLYKQGMPSTDSTNDCVYHRVTLTGVTIKCGVGFLIPENVYLEEFENNSASYLFEFEAFKALFEPEVDRDFLDALQRDLHDQFTVDWENTEKLTYREWLIDKAKLFVKEWDLALPEIIETEIKKLTSEGKDNE